MLVIRSFDPYGVPLSGDWGTPFGYTGEYRDESGLVFLRARYLQPEWGSFLSRDKRGGIVFLAVSQNAFLYVGNDPLNYTDPSGHQKCIPPTNGGLGCTGIVGGDTLSSDSGLPVDPGTMDWSTPTPTPGPPSWISVGPTQHSDDGMFLVYRIPGYIGWRTEDVVSMGKLPGPEGGTG